MVGGYLAGALQLHEALEVGRLLLLALALGADDALGGAGGAGALRRDGGGPEDAAREGTVAPLARVELLEHLDGQLDGELGAVPHRELGAGPQQVELAVVRVGAVRGDVLEGVPERAALNSTPCPSPRS